MAMSASSSKTGSVAGSVSSVPSATSSGSSTSEIDISITSENATAVELCLRIRGLIPKKGVSKFMHRVNKPKRQPHPDDLVSNAKFAKWNITAESLEIDLTVESRNEASARFFIKIRKFPSLIDSDSVQLSVKQPPGRNYSFILLKCRKRTPTADWKKFLADNGTLDTTIDEEEPKKPPTPPILQKME